MDSLRRLFRHPVCTRGAGLATFALCLLSLSPAQSTPLSPAPSVAPRIDGFIPNRGQWDEHALFLGQTPTANVWITHDGITLEGPTTGPSIATLRGRLRSASRISGESKESGADAKSVSAARRYFRLRFLGGSKNAQAVGLEPGTARTHYRIGNDPKQWATNLPGYRSVELRGLYPGIDAVVSIDERSNLPRYDFLIHPGAAVSEIRTKVEGARQLRVLPSGDIRYTSPLGNVFEHVGRVFELPASLGQNRAVGLALSKDASRLTAQLGSRDLGPAGRRIRSDGSLGFRVAGRRARTWLLIDPELEWGTVLGGSTGNTSIGGSLAYGLKGLGLAGSIAVNPDGSVIAVGATMANTLPGYEGVHSKYEQVFVTKFSAAGKVVWTDFLGGYYGDCWGDGVAVDKQGTIWVCGEAGSIDFTGISNDYTDYGDGFISQISQSGAVQGGLYYGGVFYDEVYAISLPPNGDSSTVFIAGWTESNGLPGAGNTIYPAGAGGFVAEFEPNQGVAGKNFPPCSTWYLVAQAEQPGTIDTYGYVFPLYLKALSDQEAVVWGITNSYSFPGALNGCAGNSDGFVTDVALIQTIGVKWSRYVGGSGYDYVIAGDVDKNGSVYSAGFTYSSLVDGQENSSGVDDALVTKCSSDGKTVDWTWLFGSSSNTWVNAMVLAEDGSLIVGGGASSGLPGAVNSDAGGADAFVSDIKPNGSVPWSMYLGGSGGEWIQALATENDGTIIAAGNTYSSKLADFSGGATNGMAYGFVAKIVPKPMVSVSPSSAKNGQTVTGTVSLDWSVPAGAQALTLTSSSSLATVPATLSIAAGSSSGTFKVTTVPVAADEQATIAAQVNGKKTTATLTLKGPRPSSLKVNKPSVTGGAAVSLTATLDSPAPPAGVTLNVSTTGLAGQVFPSTVEIGGGNTTATVSITSSPVASNESGTISVSLNGTTKSTPLEVLAPTLSKLSLSPTSLIGGATSTGTVTIDGNAGPDGAVVALSSNSKSATVPKSVTVPAGKSQATFQVTTTKVTSTVTATITAQLNGSTKTATLTVKT